MSSFRSLTMDLASRWQGAPEFGIDRVEMGMQGLSHRTSSMVYNKQPAALERSFCTPSTVLCGPQLTHSTATTLSLGFNINPLSPRWIPHSLQERTAREAIASPQSGYQNRDTSRTGNRVLQSRPQHNPSDRQGGCGGGLRLYGISKDCTRKISVGGAEVSQAKTRYHQRRGTMGQPRHGRRCACARAAREGDARHCARGRRAGCSRRPTIFHREPDAAVTPGLE